MYVSLASMIVNISTSIILSRMIGLNGIAIGTIIATVIMAVTYCVLIRRDLPDYHGLLRKTEILHTGIIIIICALSSIAAKALTRSSLLSFTLAVGASGLLAFTALWLLKDRYILMITRYIAGHIRALIKE